MPRKERSDMFVIETWKKHPGGGEVTDSKDDIFIYCPLSELRYIISNTNDKSVEEWFIIKRAIRIRDHHWVNPKEVFGEDA